MTPAEVVPALGSWPYIVIFCSVSFYLGILFHSRLTRTRYSRRVLKLSDEVRRALSNQCGKYPLVAADRYSFSRGVRWRSEHPAHRAEHAAARGARSS